MSSAAMNATRMLSFGRGDEGDAGAVASGRQFEHSDGSRWSA
jgi:hypothetical protein